uniref:Signal recognition particle subunit SRP72 n=1 Tax=Gossypium raimondii TaxID=29730 RepID=A0A0D2TW27_GOSRA|nr:hypothetical protein B456_009G334100 [Gossypium raimondii]
MAPKPKEKPKAAASPSQPPPPIEDLFTSLNRHIQRSEFTQAVKVANQVLSVAPGDEDAIRCEVVALIKADKIEEALSAIQSSHKVSFDFSFYKAYCLYRQNKLDEALEVLGKQDKTQPSMLLESQILYRLGKMDACVDICRNLQKAKIDSLEINLVAGLISAGRASEVQGTLDAIKTKATSSFELAYNIACSLIAGNKLKDAEKLLLTARRIGQETLTEENLADDDIEIELAPIAVQLAYVHQLLGQTQEAAGAYTDIVNRNLADEPSLAVAVNNLIAVKGPKEISDSLRKLDRLKEKDSQKFELARAIDMKLSPKQKETIYANRVLLLLHANKMDQARELVAVLPEMFPDNVMPLLLQAAVLVRENKAGKAEEMLGQFAERFPEKSKIILLARAQEAAHLYEELVKSNGNIEALVGLITTVAHANVEKAEAYEKQLKSLPGLKGVDVDALEKTSGAKPVDGASRAGLAEAQEDGKTKEKSKKKRKRKPRYPKGFDPANPGPPPDPERWLPKRERSSYRPKRKDKRAAQVRGSQGAVVRDKNEPNASATNSNTSNSKSNQATSSKGVSQSAEPSRPQSKSSRKKSRK